MLSCLTSLKRIPLFEGVSEKQLEHLARVAVTRKFPRHRTIVHAGDTTSALFVIVRGTVKVLSRDVEGREVILTLLAEGECFGEMGLIDGEPRSADVVAFDSCELLEISRADFVRILTENTELCLNIMKSLVLRLRQANWKIESLALMDVYGRVAKHLMDLAEDVNGLRLIQRKVSKQDIAKMVGASREMVTRVMKDLEAKGFIRVKDDGIEIVAG